MSKNKRKPTEPVAVQPEFPCENPQTAQAGRSDASPTADTLSETTAPEAVTETSESEPETLAAADPETDAVETDVETEPALDPEPEIAAVLQRGQCPRCRHQCDVHSSNVKKLGPPQRVVIPVVFDGVTYQVVETYRIMCEKCGQIHCVKTYK